jgi:hypothetical protein
VGSWGGGRDWGLGLDALPAGLQADDCPPGVWEFLVVAGQGQ